MRFGPPYFCCAAARHRPPPAPTVPACAIMTGLHSGRYPSDAMKLRTQINLLITFLIALFIAALVALDVDAAQRSIREELEAATRITVQLLGTIVNNAQLGGEGVSPRALT